MGTGLASGENRAIEAAQMAINSPLLEDISIDQAKGVLINVTGSSKMTMDEINESSTFVKNEVHKEAEIIWGMVFDDSMGDEIRITVIATGISDKRDRKVINIKDIEAEGLESIWTKDGQENLEKPTFQRKMALQDTDILQEGTSLKPSKRSIVNRFFQREDLEYPTFLRKQAD
jgi:cell division protein FtsZ